MKTEDAGLPGAGRAVGGLPVEAQAAHLLVDNELDRMRLHGLVTFR